jgi:hypothetical protein
MLFGGCFGGAGCDSLHFLAAAADRNTLIPDHSDNVAAVLADIELDFFHGFSS